MENSISSQSLGCKKGEDIVLAWNALQLAVGTAGL
jgi:hypothetical protein